MSEHTPEPWSVSKEPRKVMTWITSESKEGLEKIGVGSPEEAYKFYGGFMIGESITPENAERIVECVNALAGISNPAELISVAKEIELLERSGEIGVRGDMPGAYLRAFQRLRDVLGLPRPERRTGR